MFNNIDPIFATYFVFVVLVLFLSGLGIYIANEIQKSLDEERIEEITKLARATGMIDHTKHN